MATPISQQFSLPSLDTDGNALKASPEMFTLTLTDGTTVQLQVQDEVASKTETELNSANHNFPAQTNTSDFILSGTTNSSTSCPTMMPLDPTIQPSTIDYPPHHQVMFHNFQSPGANSGIIEATSLGNNAKNSVMGAQREHVMLQDVDLSNPIHEKHEQVQVEDFDDILKNIIDSADGKFNTETGNPSKGIPLSTRTHNATMISSENINKDVTLQLAAPITSGDDEDMTKLNSLQTTLSSMSSYLSHLKTGLKGYDLPEHPTDAFDSLTASNFPDLLNYHEKGSNELSKSKGSTKKTPKSFASTSKYNKNTKASTYLKEESDEENKLESDSSDFIDDELLSMFTSVHNTTIESLKARLLASRLPDGSSETDLGALLVAAKIDLTIDDIVVPPLNAVKKLMDSHALTDWQQTLCLKIRRRKKNTVSAVDVILFHLKFLMLDILKIEYYV